MTKMEKKTEMKLKKIQVKLIFKVDKNKARIS